MGIKDHRLTDRLNRYALESTRFVFLYVLLGCGEAAFAAAGDKVWDFSAGGTISGSSAAVGLDGTIHIAFIALDPDGTEKWRVRTPLATMESPAISSDGTIYYSMGDDVRAINPDGSDKWWTNTNSYVGLAPAIGPDGSVLVSNRFSGEIVALHPEDGSEAWAFDPLGGARGGGPASIGPDGTIYFLTGSNAGANNFLYALNADGTEKWRAPAIISFSIRPIIDSSRSRIYYAGEDTSGTKNVVAVDFSGNEVWRFPITSGSSSAARNPSIGQDGTIYVGGDYCELLAINDDGTLKWSKKLNNLTVTMASTPAVGADGVIYATCGVSVYAVSPDGATVLWSFATGWFTESSPVITPEGTLYIGSQDSRIYAIETSSQGLIDSSWPMFGAGPSHTSSLAAPINPPPFDDGVIRKVPIPTWSLLLTVLSLSYVAQERYKRVAQI